MTEVVLDASALIALIRNEPGAEKVAAYMPGLHVSAVNICETIGKMLHYGQTLESVERHLNLLPMTVHGFDGTMAKIAASLLPTTRPHGLSLGDRACLSLGLVTRIPVLTTERIWEKVDVDVEVVVIR